MSQAADAHAHPHSGNRWALTLAALGIVFGDIGTSPLYTLKECAHALGGENLKHEDLYGILSMVFWSLTMVVTVKYLTFIMRANNHGEGGIFALLALVPKRLSASQHGRIQPLAIFAIIGAALLYGDGIITPAISVLSAVEGLTVANADLTPYVVPITIGILLALFSIQSRGTGLVGKLFGPIMLVWFVVLGALGFWHLLKEPGVLVALSPHYSLEYFWKHGWGSLHILASVVLAVTGGEALYADMGHFGIGPIRMSWLACVLPSLLLAYFGQAAHIIHDPGTARNPFFTMVPAGLPTYLLVILSSLAAVIASQALISGAFSLTRQAVQLGYFPRVTVKHTAQDTEGQIYVPAINVFLAVGCVLLVLFFKTSSNLAAAYGIAVTGTMAITSVMYYLVVRESWNWPVATALPLLLMFFAFDLPFLVANIAKFFHGGYVPILIGVVITFIMALWARGRSLMSALYALRFPTAESAMERINSRLAARVPGTAVFMASSPTAIPPILALHVERSRALQENVILLHVRIEPEPSVEPSRRYEICQDEYDFHRLTIRFGFMEDPQVMPVLREAVAARAIPFVEGDVTYYLGRENFVASSKGRMGALAETIFAFFHKNSVAADRHFGLPHRQVCELGTQMDL
ncbi:MAG: KUP/HAK/KT family potassium transporter [Bryobacteraceae bacterium]|nr:KUP/HAK/KT family potassium transporter [Bryobacteraceae bacterium]